MLANSLKNKAEALLSKADIQINGDHPWDPQIHNSKFYARVFSQGALGLGEAYMDGWWDCQELDTFFYRVLNAEVDRSFKVNFHSVIQYIRAFFVNLQSSKRAYEIGEHHYDRGKDLYQAMLDDRMVYTAGYWPNATTLNEAQEAKLNLACSKLNLQAGQHVLDIGCGWGSFAKYAAEKYDVKVTGVTVSKEQVELGRKMCNGLPVDIRLEDYRKVDGEFDRIVSLGMFEHVGYKNYKTFMQTVANHLKSNGLFLLHSIGGNRSEKISNRWTTKYIFPNSMIPSVHQVGEATEGRFVMEDWHNFGPDYGRTLMAWYDNFNKAWDRLKDHYSDRFYRMWKYYLLSSAGGFRSRRLQSWQIVFSPRGIEGGFTPPRYRQETTSKKPEKIPHHSS